MNENLIAIVEFLIKIIRIYFIAGFIFTVPFLLFGIQKLDDGAQWEWSFWGIINGIGFRILITPATCTFWPLFAIRLIRGKSKPTERNAHRILAKQN